ncbi:MAG: hypothetical protein WC758_07535 [Candidatus Woesearchaeota archaeon]|jgi:hypothetical protein
MENEIKKEDKLGPKPSQEIAVWGLGLTNNKLDCLIDKFDKLLEKLEKVDKKLFFLEKRQQEWYENYVKAKV